MENQMEKLAEAIQQLQQRVAELELQALHRKCEIREKTLSGEKSR
jgi:hypothetical protein